MTTHNDIKHAVQHWLETMVIGLNLCPFAQREYINNRIRFVVSDADNEADLIEDLKHEFLLLNNDDQIETTLLIHPMVLQDFYDYNEFLEQADNLIYSLDLEGIYQVASFHPHYQFADTQPDDVENYTNRSPYPLLHLIREQSLEQAVANYPHPEQIPERNVALLKDMGLAKILALLNSK